MAPKIYWYPESGGLLRKCDFTGVANNFTTAEPAPQMDRGVGISRVGGVRSSMNQNLTGYRFTLRRFSGVSSAGQTLARKLEAIEEHLKLGGMICVANNASKSWSAFAKSNISQSDREIYVTTETFGGALESGQVPAANDEIYLQAAYPNIRRERLVVSAYNSSTRKVTLGSLLGASWHLTAPVFLHHRDFYVAMVLDPSLQGTPLLTSEFGRRAWTWDCTLIQDGATLANLAEQAGSSGWSDTDVIKGIDLGSTRLQASATDANLQTQDFTGVNPYDLLRGP